MSIFTDAVIELISNKVVMQLEDIAKEIPTEKAGIKPLVKGMVGSVSALLQVPYASKNPAAAFGLLCGVLAGGLVPGVIAPVLEQFHSIASRFGIPLSDEP